MFKKLLSNLPFNPSLIQQVSFYSKRMHKEEAVRRTGLILVVLSMLLQFWMIASPAEASLSSSNNDIIPGGITSQQQALQLCNANSYDFATILKSYGIICANIAGANVTSIKSTDSNRQLYSMGRLPYAGKFPHKDAEEIPWAVPGVPGNFYLRQLWAWDTGAYSTYTALSGHNVFGAPFYVLFDCGNLVMVGKPASAPAPTPHPEIVSKTTIPGMVAANSEVKPGDLIGYRILFKNSGNAAANNVYIEDSVPGATSFISQGSGGADRYSYTDTVYPGHGQEPHVYWAYNSMPAGASGYYVDFTVKVNTGVTDGSQICNTAFIRSSDTPQTPSNQICHKVKLTAPARIITPPSAPPTVTVTPPPATPAPVIKPCDTSSDQNDTTACLILSKNAKNISVTGNVNADGTTVAAGNVIQFTLSATNTGKATVKDFVIQDNIADSLEYADVTNFGEGTMDSNKIVSWPKVTIKAGETVQKQFLIKIKDVIPTTNTPKSNPGSYDCVITNVYSNSTPAQSVNIKIPCSVVKTTEQITTTALPNTGPGTTIALSFGLTVFVGYFFARSRLFARELDIIKVDYATHGGQ